MQKLKKLFTMALLGLLTCFLVVGCGKKEEDTTAAGVNTDTQAAGTETGTTAQPATEAKSLQQEILSFVGSDLPGIESERNEAVAIYNAYFNEGSDKDADKWMTSLSEQALPKYDSYLQKLNAIPVEHEDVANLKMLYVESADLQRAAIEDVINAIKNVDSSLLGYAQQKVDDSEAKLEEYETALRNLCAANNITLEGSVTPDE